MPRLVIIVEYDPQRPVLYEEERNRILGVADRRILAVEHIASTAVPGLAAKPIIDMMAGVRCASYGIACPTLMSSQLNFSDAESYLCPAIAYCPVISRRLIFHTSC